MKWSPLQIRHLTVLFASCALMLCCSGFSSFAFAFQLMLGLNMMFSPMLVVSNDGPEAFPFSSPNLGHAFRSATREFTRSLMMVVFILRVVLTFLPSSLKRKETMVLVPSLLVVICCCGSTVGSSNSSSSAQSRRLEGVKSTVEQLGET